ncbi:MAG TPA: tetratricopeptide repeat protein [Anaeromyxobacter sp.]|nr:tetratricopeptide repeat protein [Anaeromyxobacter sp.]
MKPCSTLALLALAACATPGGHVEAPPRPRQDLVAVRAALVAIDAAERKGTIAHERQVLSQAAQQSPQDPARRFLAVSAEPSGDDRWAAFKALAQEFPDSAYGQLGMARTYLAWGVLDQADRSVAAALEVEPDCWLAVRVRAELSLRRGKLESAAADFRTVLSADPEDPEAHLGLARVAQRSGDYQAAQVEATAAVKLAPDLFGAYLVLGDLALHSGDTVTAADFYAGAVEASPRDRAARVQLAKLLETKGDHAGARDQWKAAASLREDAESLAGLAREARATGDAAGEASALERLSQLDAGAAEWGRVAELRLAAGDLDGAEKAYRHALARDPRDPQANLGLGRVQLAAGRPQEAMESLRAAGPAGRPDLEALQRRLNVERVERGEVAQLQRTVQQLVDRTFRARRAAAPSLSGNLRLRVTVDGAGAATLVEVLEDTVHDEDVRACAYWNLRDAAYPSEKPGRYSFAFAFRR